jgi:hypothetical protein
LSCIVPLAEIADDFHLAEKTTIETILWETIDDSDYNWNGLADLIVYEYSADGPGVENTTLLEIQSTREYLGEQSSRPWYRYTIDLKSQGEEFDLQAGDYFILLRPYTAGDTGQSFWVTSPPPASSTSESYFRCEYFGYPNWIKSTTVFGDPYDVNFKIYNNLPPQDPVIEGPLNGKVGVEHTYYLDPFVDPEGDDVYAYFEWGDGDNTGWLGPFSSGEEINASHTWDDEGEFLIRAQLKDEHGAESGWGELSVTMPRSKVVYNSFIQQILQLFPNAYPLLRFISGLLT